MQFSFANKNPVWKPQCYHNLYAITLFSDTIWMQGCIQFMPHFYLHSVILMQSWKHVTHLPPFPACCMASCARRVAVSSLYQNWLIPWLGEEITEDIKILLRWCSHETYAIKYNISTLYCILQYWFIYRITAQSVVLLLWYSAAIYINFPGLK